MIVSDYIYRNYANLDEGDLTKIRASVVCENSLAALAARLELGSYMYLGHGEIVTHGRNRKSIVADAFEALLAAIYLDRAGARVPPADARGRHRRKRQPRQRGL